MSGSPTPSGPSSTVVNTSHIGLSDDPSDGPYKPTHVRDDSSPPSYAAVVAADSSAHGQPQPYPQSIPYPHPHPHSQQQPLLQDFYNQYSQAHQHNFGPTPISNSLPVLPYAYYQQREDADRRALVRFVSTILVVVGIYVILGTVVGMEVGGVW